MIMMMGALLVSFLALLSTSYQRREIQKVSENKFAVDIIQQNMTNYLQDEDAWKKTFNDPANASTFSCLINGTACNKSPQLIMVLRNPNNEMVASSASDKGMNPDGKICSRYSGGGGPTTSQNQTCSYNIAITWRPICAGVATCTSSPNVIEINTSITNANSANSSARFIASSGGSLVRKPTSDPDASEVMSGDEHTCAIAQGEVYCWGLNNVGQLGRDPGVIGFSRSPLKVPGISGASDLTVGFDHNCVIAGGRAICWGSDWLGKLGIRTGCATWTPSPIREHYSNLPLTGVTKISLGWSEGCAIVAGAAYCWGSNIGGQLGLVRPQGPAAWVKGSMADYALTYDGYADGDGRGAYLVPTLASGVLDISAGEGRVCAIITGGKLVCWGSDSYTGGIANACGIGTYSLGYNPFNAAGDPGTRGYRICYPYLMDAFTFALPGGAPSATTWNVRADGSTVTDGGMFRGSTAMNSSSCADGTPTTKFDRRGICNPTPQTPADSALPNAPDHPNLIAGVKQIATAGMSNCALIADNTLRCWGANWGKLAIVAPNWGSQFPVPPDNSTFTLDSLGSFVHGYCGLKGGRLYCWGGWNNGFNPIGIPGGGQIWTPTLATGAGMPTNISYFKGGFGNNHNCLVSAKRVWCWGKNSNGQLGDGTTTNRTNGNPVKAINWQ